MNSSSLEFLREIRRRTNEDDWDDDDWSKDITRWVIENIDELIGLYQTKQAKKKRRKRA